MQRAFEPRSLGPTKVRVGPLGLGSSYGVGAADVERAFERGVTFFLWGSRRRAEFGVGLKNVAARRREDVVIAIQSYTRTASLLEWSVDRALRSLRTDYVDVLCLAWWNGPPPPRIVDEALRLRDEGKARSIMVSSHHRPTLERVVDDARFDSLMVRYNAAHPGAEREVFPHFVRRRPGVVAFTATRWGTLLDPRLVPHGEDVPRASDCYRFALSNENVDVCLAGPKDAAELDEALSAATAGPLTAEELAWMRRVGGAVRAATAKPNRIALLDAFDRIASSMSCTPKKLASSMAR